MPDTNTYTGVTKKIPTPSCWENGAIVVDDELQWMSTDGAPDFIRLMCRF